MAETARLAVITVDSHSERRGRGETVRRIVESEFAVDQLEGSLARFLGMLGALLDTCESRSGAFELDEVEFSAEIGADGEFKLIGTGVGVSASSAVSLRWKRRDTSGGGSASGADDA
jgi:hypothetical protein